MSSILAFVLAMPLGGGDDDEDVVPILNNISRLLTAICTAGVQPVEDCLRQLLDQRSLDTAIGAQLDIIGKLVGQPRNGLDDDTYRRYCRATVAAHRSHGAVENILNVASLVVFDDAATYTLVQQQVATVELRIEGIAVTDALAAIVFTFVRTAAAVGVRIMVTYGLSPPAEWFRFDSGPGFNQGKLVGRIG